MIEAGTNVADEIVGDICIVGSGPAGMTVALELERRGISCILLESGTEEPSRAHTQLNETRQVGITTDQNTVNRLRGLGGTSAHWGGLVRPLDAMDFEKRDWVPGSGWPITQKTLLPYYTTAHQRMQLPQADYALQTVEPDASPLADPEFENVVFYHDKEPLRFGQHYLEHLKSSSRIRTVVDATVVDMVSDAERGTISALTVATLQGRRFTVRARQFVLAAGAIQTARLLMHANRENRLGLGDGSGIDHRNDHGNAHGQVGRYFMQHPVLYGPRLLLFNDRNIKRLRRNSGMAAIRTAVTPTAAQHHRLLNSHVFPLQSRPPGRREQVLSRMPGALRHLMEGTALGEVGDVGLVPHYQSDLRPLLQPDVPYQHRYAPLEFRTEQAPNPDSRITLDDQRDALGVPLARMDWRLGERDRESWQNTLRLFGACVGRHGLGRLQAGPDQLRLPAAGETFLHGGNHHYGKTRMGTSAKDSVVDADCRVHSLKNLYIAGSAVFPTTGHANPTLTIVALSVRLADRLAARNTSMFAG